MNISVFDLFKVGIGPSSSHTTGPMRAGHRFVEHLEQQGKLENVERVRVELLGSLGATGRGHLSVEAVLLGLGGERPETVDPSFVAPFAEAVQRTHRLRLAGVRDIVFDVENDLILDASRRLDHHTNGMEFRAFDAAGSLLEEATYFSVGGGFVVELGEIGFVDQDGPLEVPYPFATAQELLVHTKQSGLPIAEIVLANECTWRSEKEVRKGIMALIEVMNECISRGCAHDGVLPGPLRVERRAPSVLAQLEAAPDGTDPLRAVEWVLLWALAVNEENAAGGRVVTAPTNGAAGIIPAVLRYIARFHPGSDQEDLMTFLLTASAIGVLFKQNASISGAEVGCQGEVGSACSMAAAGLAAVLGGSPEQVENAAEIGIEHNLGLTCDPVGGLVQIPCIERNAVAAIQAITAARMAILGTGKHQVSLDNAILTMKQTGADMQEKYKETSRGGLALNVVEC